MLQIYNTLHRKKQDFVPIEPGKVNMYVCGMTVYDYCHLGHARVVVVFDTVTRYMRSRDYQVTYVRNITDIDDKIIQRANENGEEFMALTQRFVDAMHDDFAALGVLPPDIEPRATDSIPQIVNMIKKLVERGYAYVADNGDVLYDVSKFEGYGKLSGKIIDELRAGERVAIDESKDDPLDFVLWKQAKPDEPAWESPWGNGRPGWHIECSAMSTDELGDHFDIHGGGMDLQFPHHENEIAQSEGATGHPFVNYWMHNGFVRINDEKMSKSLNNFFTVREVLEKYRAEEIRYFILTSQYRSPLNYDEEHLLNARGALTRFYTSLRDIDVVDEDPVISEPWVQRFNTVMDDDFNTPEALAVLFDLVRAINKARDVDTTLAQSLAACLRRLGGILGLLQAPPEDWFQNASAGETGLAAEDIETLLAERIAARDNKDWAEADRIRDHLAENNISIEDGAGGTTWRRV